MVTSLLYGYQGQSKDARFTFIVICTILICLVNAGCLADSENPEMSLVQPEGPKFHIILCRGS